MPAPARILITGSTGFVGRRLAAQFERQFPGCIIDDLGGVGRSGEITEGPDVDEALARKPDLVVHLAARSSVGQAASAGAETIRVNVLGTLRLAEGLRRHAPGVPLIFASSGETYGASFQSGQPLTEDAPLQPGNAYARSKVACEHVLRDLLSDVSPVIALRLFNHTGPGQDERFVIPTFAAQIARIEAGLAAPKLRVGNLEASRDFMHVDDVIDAYGAIAASDHLQTPGWSVYNVASGRAVRIQTILDKLVAMSRVPLEVETDPARLRPSDIPVAVGDPGRFAQAFGWQSRRSLDTLLAEVLAYWREAVLEPTAG